MEKYIGVCLISSFVIFSTVLAFPTVGRWRSVPYVAQYGRDLDVGIHRQGQGQGYGGYHGGGGVGGYQSHYPSSYGSGGGGGYGGGSGYSYHFPIQMGGKSTYIQKLIPIFQLGGHLTSFLQSRSSYKHGWHFEDSHQQHGSIWSASGHPHPVPVRQSW